ncbi:hypothetical protein GRAN_1368 [Granulicella sibirica]|uniref:Uncharacterized protein n=1 Tax=Granulicella sibirica TaxID=2479048 RepID=A0A4Q0T7H3_9BACT|nr:hypothetical protein GRAN_1368 [Granulicella sibirica]
MGEAHTLLLQCRSALRMRPKLGKVYAPERRVGSRHDSDRAAGPGNKGGKWFALP